MMQRLQLQKPEAGEGACVAGKIGANRVFRESCVIGKYAGLRVGKRRPRSGAFRHCKAAACILGLTGANMRLSLICGFPC